MNLDQEVRFYIGDLLITNISLRHQLDAAQKRISELETAQTADETKDD